MTVFVFHQMKSLHIIHVTEDSRNDYHRVIQKVARIDLEIPVHNHYRQTFAESDLKKTLWWSRYDMLFHQSFPAQHMALRPTPSLSKVTHPSVGEKGEQSSKWNINSKSDFPTWHLLSRQAVYWLCSLKSYQLW